MEIEFNKRHTEVEHFVGTIDKVHKFQVNVMWWSDKDDYVITRLDFDKAKDVELDTNLASKRIRKLIKARYYEGV